MRREPFEQPPPLALQQLKTAGPPGRGIISHGTAAAVHGFPLINAVTVPTLLLPRGYHAKRFSPWEVHSSAVASADLLETADGFPVTGLRRTALDCARTLPLYDAVAILDWVLNRKLVPLRDLQAAAASARGRGAGKLQRAVRLCDGRAESAQESVARVALRAVGVPCQPQYALVDGPFEHHFDLGLAWAHTVVDLQSRAHHSSWSDIKRDIGYLQLVNVTPGWKLALTVPTMVLPSPTAFVRAVLDIVVQQSGERCRSLRRRYVDADGALMSVELATKEAKFLR